MKQLYQAANLVEAHMILHLIEQQGLTGRVDGEYLQGGIGELPVAGLVRVMVEEDDFDAARRIVETWDAAQPAQASATPAASEVGKKSHTVAAFAAGLVIGLVFAAAYFHVPVETDGIDHNRDDALDERWTYAASGHLLKVEVDRNLDRKIDYVARHGKDGLIASVTLDDDFNGSFESQQTSRFGNPVLVEVDTDGDGYRELRQHFKYGVLASIETVVPATGLPERVEHFVLGILTHAEIDTDKDGKLDQRKRYGRLGEVVTVENIGGR